MPSVIDFTAYGALDIARPPKEVLIERLNAIHGLQLDPSHFELANPVVADGLGYNTYIWVMPVASSSWSNGMQIYYNRMELTSLMQHTASVPTGGEENLYAILDTVNAAYGVYLTEADIQDAVIAYDTPEDPLTSTGRVLLRARETSVFFKGEYTIPINNSASHGIGTYDEEMLHFTLTHDTALGRDTIVAFNELGELEANFNFLHNASPSSATIRHMWKDAYGALTLIGSFDLGAVPGLELEAGHYKVLWLNSTGAVTKASAGNLFGADFVDLQYYPDVISGKVFVLDVGNEIGGNNHGIHVFDWSGVYNNGFTSTLSDRATALAVHNGKLYVSTFGNYTSTLHRLALNGATDTTFPATMLLLPSVRGGVDYCTPIGIAASDEGVAVMLETHMRAGNFPETPLPWAEYTDRGDVADGHCVPVVFLDHSGAPNTAITERRPYHTNRRLGLVAKGNQLTCNDQTVLYSAQVTSPVTGATTQGVVAARLDGTLAPNCTQTTAALYPYFQEIKAMYTITRGDFLVAANIYNEEHEVCGALYFFSNDGVLATRELYLDGHELKSVISHSFV